MDISTSLPTAAAHIEMGIRRRKDSELVRSPTIKGVTMPRFQTPLPAEQAQRARETAHAMLEYRGYQKSEIARVLASQ